MRNTIILIAVLMILAGRCNAKDAFDSIHCGDDIAKALIGKASPDGPVAAIEKKHGSLGLADEGGEEVSDSVSYTAWKICGHSYHLLDSGGKIRDVVLADHSRQHPGFLGSCEKAGQPTPFLVFGILDAAAMPESTGHVAPNDKTLLAAVSAWQIDEARPAFVKLETEKLKCPVSGISTLDGGP